jgi:hypothetical protein
VGDANAESFRYLRATMGPTGEYDNGSFFRLTHKALQLGSMRGRIYRQILVKFLGDPELDVRFRLGFLRQDDNGPVGVLFDQISTDLDRSKVLCCNGTYRARWAVCRTS